MGRIMTTEEWKSMTESERQIYIELLDIIENDE